MDDTSVLAMDLDDRDEGLSRLSDALNLGCSPSILLVPIESIMSGGKSTMSGQMERVSLWATFAGQPCDLDPSTYSLFVSGATNGLKKGDDAEIARALWTHKLVVNYVAPALRSTGTQLTLPRLSTPWTAHLTE